MERTPENGPNEILLRMEVKTNQKKKKVSGIYEKSS